jgi:hypothetical protein
MLFSIVYWTFALYYRFYFPSIPYGCQEENSKRQQHKSCEEEVFRGTVRILFAKDIKYFLFSNVCIVIQTFRRKKCITVGDQSVDFIEILLELLSQLCPCSLQRLQGQSCDRSSNRISHYTSIPYGRDLVTVGGNFIRSITYSRNITCSAS